MQFHQALSGIDAEAADRILFLTGGIARASWALLFTTTSSAGAPPQWLVEPHEAHGFYGEGAREMYAAVLDFLRANTAAQREVR